MIIGSFVLLCSVILSLDYVDLVRDRGEGGGRKKGLEKRTFPMSLRFVVDGLRRWSF